MIILVDTREKENWHILRYFHKNNIEFKIKKLNYGDYSFELDGVSFENKICIERKSGLDEISGNITKNRQRFAREFEKAYKDKCKMYLIIENTSWGDIKEHNYRSKMHPNAFEATLKTWENKYMFTINFVRREEVGIFILELFRRFIDAENSRNNRNT